MYPKISDVWSLCIFWWRKKKGGFTGAAFLVLVLFFPPFFLTSNLPSVTYHINSSRISTKCLPEFPSLLRLDSMKKLLFCVSIFKSLFDSFPHCVYRFSKIQSAKSIYQQVLNYRKFLLISGSSREISKQSNCRSYCSREFWHEGNSEVS